MLDERYLGEEVNSLQNNVDPNDGFFNGFKIYIDLLKTQDQISDIEYEEMQASLNSQDVKKITSTAAAIELINGIPMRAVFASALAFFLVYTEGNMIISYIGAKGVDKSIKFIYSCPIARKQKVPCYVLFSFINALPYAGKYLAPPIWLRKDKTLMKYFSMYAKDIENLKKIPIDIKDKIGNILGSVASKIKTVKSIEG